VWLGASKSGLSFESASVAGWCQLSVDPRTRNGAVQRHVLDVQNSTRQPIQYAADCCTLLDSSQ